MGLHNFTVGAFTHGQTVANLSDIAGQDSLSCGKAKGITKFLYFENIQPGVVVPGFDPIIWETETGVLT